MSVQPFARLDPALPLALLPVRLEARYLPHEAPTELVVRIFPDEIHADGHLEELTEREERAGQAYWRAVWGSTDSAAITAAREWLAGRCGHYRALWVATATTPLSEAAPGDLVFPKLVLRAADEPVRAKLLPDQWMVRLYNSAQQLVHTTFTSKVLAGLPVAPKLVGMNDAASLDAFLAGQGLEWTINVQKAVDVGMAVRIPLANVPNPVGALLVTGVRADRDPLAEGAELDALLNAHWYTKGVDIVPQGTPTNNTDAGRSGVSVDAPDMDELFECEESERPLAPGGRAVLFAADSAMMYRVPAADAVSLAFGRVRANTLDRTAHAEAADGVASWAMNLAIGYATLGDYIDGPLAMINGRIAPGAQAPALRAWYADWVRGGGPLPVVRCGAQPYGLLPITTEPAFAIGAFTGFRDLLEHQLADFVRTWDESLPTAALDPDATDARPTVTPAADAVTVGEVLGAVPHPTALQLRLAIDNTEADRARFAEAVADLDYHLTRDQGGIVWAETVEAWRQYKPLIDGIPTAEVPNASPPDIFTQISCVEEFRAILAPVEDDLSYGTEALAVIDDELLPMLEVHRAATQRIPGPVSNFSGNGGIGSDEVIRLVHTTYDGDAEPVSALVTSAGDITELDDLLVDLIAALDTVVAQALPVGSRDPVVTGPAPLLHHLLDQNHLQVPADQAAVVRLALQVLRAGVSSPAIPYPEAVFERLLRECLGLGTHRIDAWITSLAAERLATRRHARPAGIQVGGYGWLLDLSPSTDPASQGFIHAHSLSHAATAAVLRSGWSAYGTDSGETPLSVDLSSRRVRGGQWILDGVRNGQDLAETLGARFERYLHDDRLDVWIDTVRQIVLDVAGSTGPASAIVDGLLVARASSQVDQTTVEATLHAELWAATAPTGNAAEDAQRAGVRRALLRVAADLDSVADVTMAQSVHSLLRSNTDAAAGSLAITGSGDAAVPPITVTASQRDSQLVSHRVVAVWPVGPAPASRSVLGVAEPRLTVWIESLLGASKSVAAHLTVRDAGGTVVERTALTLEAIGLTAIEAAHLAGASATQAGSRLGRIVMAVAADRAVDGRTVEVDLASSGSSDTTVLNIDEFGLLASAAMNAVGRGRALRQEDLTVPGAEPGTAAENETEIAQRVTDVESRLDGLSTDLGSADPAKVRAALLRCAALDVPGAVVALETGGDEAVATVVAALADRRLPPAAPPAGSPTEQSAARLRQLVNAALPILPVFTPPADPDRAVSAGFARRMREVAEGGHRWLRQAARVRTAVGAIAELLLLSEAVRGGAKTRYGLMQLPHFDEGWAAISPLVGQRERLSVFSLTGVDALAATAKPIAGLFVDGWTEGIPRNDQLTGIAVHFDAPTARAPNAILLSVVEDEPGFSAGEISEQLLHTVHMAKLRAIPPTGIGEHGHYLPTIFLPDDIELPQVTA